MKNQRCVRAPLLRWTPIKVVVEDGFDRAIGPGANVDGAISGGLHAVGAKRTHQPDNAKTSAKALFGMRPRFEDQFAQGGRRGPIWRASARMRSSVQPA